MKLLARVHRIAFPERMTPPEGFPRVLGEWAYSHAEITEQRHYECVEERTLRDVCQLLGLYGLSSIISPTPPPKRTPPEKLAAQRRKRLRKRIIARWPLFAEEFIAEELARHPDRYAGRSAEDEASDRVREKWVAQYEHWVRLLETQKGARE